MTTQIIEAGISYNENRDKFFDLHPDVLLIIDKAKDYGYSKEQGYFWTLGQSWNVSASSTNIKYRYVLRGSAGQLTFTCMHEDCQMFKTGDRVRLKLGRAGKDPNDEESFVGTQVFAGVIFTRRSKDNNTMEFVCLDFLRYLKAELMYTKTMLTHSSGRGLFAHEIFSKVMHDLRLPYRVVHESKTPIVPKIYDRNGQGNGVPSFDIIDKAIMESLRLDNDGTKDYYMVRHNPQPFEENGKLNKWGRIEFISRNEIKKHAEGLIIGDNSLLIDYNYEDSIDKQTYTRVIVYKDTKTYTSVSKSGKVTHLKHGKKTGSRVAKGWPDVETAEGLEDAKVEGLYGFMPLYIQAGDDWTEAQMTTVARNVFKATSRETQSLDMQCYGYIGLMAGDMVYMQIEKIGGKTIEGWRTIKEIEMSVESPIKMHIAVSSAEYGEYDA